MTISLQLPSWMYWLTHGQTFSSKDEKSTSSYQQLDKTKPDRAQVKETIQSFLKRSRFDKTWRSADSSHVVNGIDEYVAGMSPPLPARFLKTFEKCKPVAAKFAVSFYPLHPVELQIRMAIGVLLITTIDDVCEDCIEDVGMFSQRFAMNEQQGNELLEHYARFLREFYTKQTYGPYSTSMIIKSSLNYIGGCYVEAQCASKMPSCATNFPRFLRLKTGYSEYFVHLIFLQEIFSERNCLEDFVFAVPELIDVTDYINDILSFFKESVVGTEDANYIFNYARTHKMTPMQSLSLHCEKAIESINRAFSVTTNPKVREYVGAYICGYINFHLSLQRYRMAELFEGDPLNAL